MGAAAECVKVPSGFDLARGQLVAMEKRLTSPELMTATHSELEEYVIEQGRELQRLLLQAHMDLRAAHERAAEVTGADGVRRTTRRMSSRPLLTLVGKVDVIRTAYQARDVDGLHPLDATLNLPTELYSHGVRRLVAERSAQSSFDEVVALLAKHTGAPVAKRQVEELAVRAALDFADFYAAARSNAEPEATEALLVLTFDGKGIVVRPEDLRAATQAAAKQAKRKLSTRLTKGEKRNRKRMAQVAAVYSVDSWVRTPMDVLHGLRPAEKKAASRPDVENKRVWASITATPAKVIEEAFQDALARDPERKRRWVVLVDGNQEQIARIRAAAKKHGVDVTLVLDVIHVLEYLWNVGHLLYQEGTPAVESWVTTRLLWLLEGRSGTQVAADVLRTMRRIEAGPDKRPVFLRTAAYLKKYSRMMNYAAYLRDGLPIATGVIEGACRYLVKDRMDRTGARWSLPGAEAVLRLRSLHASGDMDAYWTFHLQREHRRNHALRYAGESPPSTDVVPKLRRVK